MTAKEVSILAWSYGALGLRPAGLFRVLAREGLATVHEATAHDLSNLAWGLARVGVLVAEEENEGKGTKVNVLGVGVTVLLEAADMCFYISSSSSSLFHCFFLNFV